MNKITTEQMLQQKIAALPTEIKPERDLWVGIERAIESNTAKQVITEKRSSHPYMWATAASFAVLALLSLILQWTPPSAISSGQLVTLMQGNFEQQKMTLLVSFGKPKLTELPKIMQEQLQQLESARTAITQALANDEDNVDLINLLDWTQKQELELIEKLYTPQWQTI